MPPEIYYLLPVMSLEWLTLVCSVLGGSSTTFLAEEVCWSSCSSGCNSPFHSWRIYSANTISSQNNSAEVLGKFCQETSPWARGFTFLCSQTSLLVFEEGLSMSMRPLTGSGLISSAINIGPCMCLYMSMYESVCSCVPMREREKKKRRNRRKKERH